jgi:protein-disulfide isomerase
MLSPILVEVLGADPPCARCRATQNNVEVAAKGLKSEGVEVKVVHRPIMSQEVVAQYGALVSPAVAINGVVRVMGLVPSPDQIQQLIRKAAK